VQSHLGATDIVLKYGEIFHPFEGITVWDYVDGDISRNLSAGYLVMYRNKVPI